MRSSAGTQAFVNAPSDWVVRWAHLIARGARVLDLACGQGRHARYLAQTGHSVVACDRDPEALAVLAGIAGIETLQADFEDGSPWPFEGVRFGAIVVINYLHRPLFARFAEALSPGGVLIYETFALGNELYGKPSNPAFLLKRDELLDVFGATLVVAGFEQGMTARPKPALVQRLCAVRGGSTDSPLAPGMAGVAPTARP